MMKNICRKCMCKELSLYFDIHFEQFSEVQAILNFIQAAMNVRYAEKSFP